MDQFVRCLQNPRWVRVGEWLESDCAIHLRYIRGDDTPYMTKWPSLATWQRCGHGAPESLILCLRIDSVIASFNARFPLPSVALTGVR